MQSCRLDWPEIADALIRSNIKPVELVLDSNLPVLGAIFHYKIFRCNNLGMSVSFSPALFEESLDGHRLQALSFVRLLAPSLSQLGRMGQFCIYFDFDDGGSSNFLCMDRPFGSDWPLIPDRYLLERALHRSPLPAPYDDFKNNYMLRKKQLFWRGSTTGSYMSTSDQLLENRRVAFCLATNRLSADKVDCKISRVVQVHGGLTQSDARKTLERHKVFGTEVGEEIFADYQMTIDLPGNVAAWGVCQKYLSGCLVLRPPQVRELVYTHLLKPGIHYLPISDDFSSLENTLDWLLANQSEAARIAWNGRNNMIRILNSVPAIAQNALRNANTLKDTTPIEPRSLIKRVYGFLK